MLLMLMPKWLLFNFDNLLQKQMKKAFPPASKLNKSDRLIPRFRGACARNRDRKVLVSVPRTLMLSLRLFRQAAEAQRQEEEPHRVNGAAQVPAEVLQRTSEL